MAAPSNGLIVQGNVGIGTTTPSSIFAISSAAPSLIINDTRNFSPAIGTTLADLEFRTDDQLSSLTGATRGSVALVSEFNTTGAQTGLAFLTNNGSTLTEKMRISNGGNVGIGTTSPTTALQVNGVITPNADNTSSLGNSTYRWSAVYSANGTIQTSDARLKSNVADVNYGLTDLLKLRPVSFT